MIGKIKPFISTSYNEAAAGHSVLFAAYHGEPQSGYLAGKERGGKHVVRLEDAWQETFRVKHAIACNSATSGLMAAAFAAGLGNGDRFLCSPMTMSATAAAPMFTGAEPMFVDVEDETFSMMGPFEKMRDIKAIFVTNLFGHAALLARARKIADDFNWFLIEDNAQSPYAKEDGRYAGTVGDIGVWSLNVHKPLQCGEGGMMTTDNDDLAKSLRNFINHGENAGDMIGLNLRMPEVCAAVALVQLQRGPQIVAGRVAQAEAIIKAIGDIPGLRPPVVRQGCSHVYYTIPFLVEKNRAEFIASLRAEGVPIEEGYIDPLYRMPAFSQFARPCPVAEDLQDRRLFYFENCAWDPTPEQIEQIGDAFRKAAAVI